jgi:hypothetical protein
VPPPCPPPPGWDDWFEFKRVGFFDYDVNDNNTIKHFGTINGDYSTDYLRPYRLTVSGRR